MYLTIQVLIKMTALLSVMIDLQILWKAEKSKTELEMKIGEDKS